MAQVLRIGEDGHLVAVIDLVVGDVLDDCRGNLALDQLRLIEDERLGILPEQLEHLRMYAGQDGRNRLALESRKFGDRSQRFAPIAAADRRIDRMRRDILFTRRITMSQLVL